MCHLPDNGRPGAGGTRRILIVDDEPTLRLGFAYALTTDGTKADTASNGSEALAKIDHHPYDLVILDLRMPDTDGISVIEQLRDEGNDIPVVLCSALVPLNSAVRAIQGRVVDFLMKPVRPADLRQVVQRILEPGGDLLSRALDAARKGRTRDAIELLEEGKFPDTSPEGTWLYLFRALADHQDGDTAALEDWITEDILPTIAFHSAPDGGQGGRRM